MRNTFKEFLPQVSRRQKAIKALSTATMALGLFTMFLISRFAQDIDSTGIVTGWGIYLSLWVTSLSGALVAALIVIGDE